MNGAITRAVYYTALHMTYLIILVLLAFSALFSGLTLGLMSFDAHELKRKADAGDKNAARLVPLRVNGNLLLTTLLFGNVIVNSILSVFLGSLTTGTMAVIVSTFLIVILGEIFPQALFNRHAIAFASRLAWFVRVCLFVLYPVAKPISMVLDYVLGAELPSIYSKQELIHLIEDHEDAHQGSIDADEERIVKGALSFSDRHVRDVMTPRSVVHAFDEHEVVTAELIEDVRRTGASRFPIFDTETDTVVGTLHIASLLGVPLGAGKIGDYMEREVHTIRDIASLDTALEHFIKTRKHLAIVEDEFRSVVGIVTLEDIIEEIIRTEIVDERDTHADMRAFARERGKKLSI